MRILILILLLLFVTPMCKAEGADSMSGTWDSFGKTIDGSFNNVKPVTDELFNKTIEEIKSRGKKNKKKKKNEIIPLSPVPHKTDIYDNNEMQSLYNKLQHTPTIMIPTNVITDNGTLMPTGYYKLSNKKSPDNKYYLVFSQGNSQIAENHAIQTEEDYKQKDINFVDVIPISDNYIKVIYGTIDLNLETILEIKSK